MARANLESRLSLDDTRFRAGLRGAGAATHKFASDATSSMLKSAAAFAGATLAVGSLSRKFNELREEYDRVGKLATKMDLGVEQVQRLGLAASLSGTDLEKLNSAMTRATVAGNDAAKGVATYAEAFADLRIDIDAFNRLSAEDKIKALGNAFAAADDRTKAFAATYRILGKSGAELIPMLKDVGAALEQAGEAKFLSEDQIRRIEAMNDRMSVLSTTLKADLMEAFLNLEPVISGFVKNLSLAAEGMNLLTGKDPGKLIQPGSALEGVKLLQEIKRQQESALAGRFAKDPSSLERAAENEAAARKLQERFDALPMQEKLRSRMMIGADEMRAGGKSEESIKRYTDAMTKQIERFDRRDKLQAGAKQVADTIAGSLKLRPDGRFQTVDNAGVATGGSAAPGTGTNPFPPITSTGPVVGFNPPTFEELTGGRAPSLMERFREMAALEFSPTFKKRPGVSTRGRVAFGGIDGVEDPESSFGKVAFGGIGARMSHSANAAFGNPTRLGNKGQDQAKATSKGVERSNQLLEEVKALLSENLKVE